MLGEQSFSVQIVHVWCTVFICVRKKKKEIKKNEEKEEEEEEEEEEAEEKNISEISMFHFLDCEKD